MRCKNSFGTEWQQLHDHEREPGHDTNAQVGESASKCFVHFELADHQSASRWCWWCCTVSFVTSSSLFFFWGDISEIRMIQNRQDQQELIGKSLCCWSLFHIASMMMDCFACVHQSEQHRWLLHSPALMIARGVSIACVHLSTGRDACCIVTTHLCRLPLVWTSHTFDAGTATHTSSFVTFKSFDTWPTCTSLLCAWEAFGSASPKSARSVISDTRSNLCGWLNFYFPRQVLKGGQTVCFATQLSSCSTSNLRVLVAMVQYDMSADCDGEVTRGSLPCLVLELPRVVKRVVLGPSMIRQRIVKTHDPVETRSTPSWRPFGCCLPMKANRVICSNVGPTFPNHEGVFSKCGIVAGSCFHLWDSSAILLT